MRLRPLSGVERVWLVAHRLAPPFLTELCVEGEGELEAEAVGRAVRPGPVRRPAR